jgi:hypothetical protein
MIERKWAECECPAFPLLYLPSAIFSILHPPSPNAC